MFTRRARAIARPTRRRLLVGSVVATLAIALAGTPVIVAGATGVGVALKMGVQNTVSAATTLVATTTGFAFTVKNQGTGGGIQINVKTGKSPISVSAGAGKATNLDADKLDGKDGSEIEPRIDNIRDLNGVSCSYGAERALIYVQGPEGPLLECLQRLLVAQLTRPVTWPANTFLPSSCTS